MQQRKAQDIWFFLFISAIKTHLRFVGGIPIIFHQFLPVIANWKSTMLRVRSATWYSGLQFFSGTFCG